MQVSISNNKLKLIYKSDIIYILKKELNRGNFKQKVSAIMI